MADENKSKDVLVHADHVKVYFKGKDKKSGTVRAVDDISFDIFAGETFGVVGESGCGKSTFFHLISGLTHADSGEILFEGKDLWLRKEYPGTHPDPPDPGYRRPCLFRRGRYFRIKRQSLKTDA